MTPAPRPTDYNSKNVFLAPHAAQVAKDERINIVSITSNEEPVRNTFDLVQTELDVMGRTITLPSPEQTFLVLNLPSDGPLTLAQPDVRYVQAIRQEEADWPSGYTLPRLLRMGWYVMGINIDSFSKPTEQRLVQGILDFCVTSTRHGLDPHDADMILARAGTTAENNPPYFNPLITRVSRPPKVVEDEANQKEA